MKRKSIIANIAAAAAFLFLGLVATNIHHVSSYSAFHGFVERGFVNREKLEAAEPKGASDNVMVRDMQATGSVEVWLNIISALAALACVLNAVLIYRSNKSHETPTA